MKLDAARRQLETAVQLYFEDGDPVSLHTLASAAQGIIEPLRKAANKTSLRELFLERIVPEYRDAVAARLNEAANFFKHSSRDGSAQLIFDPRVNEMLLLDCCTALEQLVPERSPVLFAFEIWVCMHTPKILKAGAWRDNLMRMREQLPAQLGPREYFRQVPMALARAWQQEQRDQRP